ncbi:MAG: hypothetical protein ACRDZO_13380 [Egibacteraceae bacterium]
MAVGSQSMKTEAGTIFGSVTGIVLGLLLSQIAGQGWLTLALIVLASTLVGRTLGARLDKRAGRYELRDQRGGWR